MQDSQALFANIQALWESIKDAEQQASILFVDLVGSTAFKSLSGPILGLQKTYLHNSVVTKLVANSGEVVKYIGDEAMVLVKGTGHASIACNLAKAIQVEFTNLNQKNQGNPMFPVESKIGIHSGPVQFWKYSGHEQLDPQGTSVDLAARIVSLAKRQQILCSEQTSLESSLPATDLGPVYERYVKGIKAPVKVREILWDGKLREISQNPLPASEDLEVRRLVREGREHIQASDFDGAVVDFSAALKLAPADFNANFGLGEVLTRGLERVNDGREYLNRAKTINPSSPGLLLLEGFLAWQEFSKTADPQRLEAAISLTQECLDLAETAMDRHSVRLAKGNLAYYLALRQKPNDLDRALQLCASATMIYDRIQTRERAGLMDTNAVVFLKRGQREDVASARKLLEEAMKLDPKNPHLYEHMAEVVRMERSLEIAPSKGLAY